MTEEQSDIAKRNYGLYFWFLNKMPLRHESTLLIEIYEDKILDAFLRACKGFNPALGFKESTYITRCLYHARSHFFDSLMYRRETVNKAGGKEVEEMINGMTQIECTLEDIETRESNSRTVEELLGTIQDEKTRAMVEMRFGLNGHKESTYKDIGIAFNLSKQRAEQIVKEFLRRFNPDY